jgi:hypothetical protein
MNMEWRSGRVEEWKRIFPPFFHSSVLPFGGWGRRGASILPFFHSGRGRGGRE